MTDRSSLPPLRPTRRQFLAAAAATTVLLACGDDADGTDAGAGSTTPEAPDSIDPSDLSVVRFFGPFFAVGASARIPFGLSDSAGLLPVDVLPDAVDVTVRDPEGSVVAEGLRAARRADGLPRPYYAFEFTPAVDGFHDFVMEVEGAEVVSQFQVVPADAPAIARRVGPGDALPPIATPTVDDPQGVTPICTREPVCDLHGRTLADVVGTGPVALLVATPAFCQTVICGPVLDLLLGLRDDHPGVSFVHAEVFVDPTQNEVPPVIDDYAPVVTELGLPYEPAFFVTDAAGVVVERLDYIFDVTDMRAALEQAVV